MNKIIITFLISALIGKSIICIAQIDTVTFNLQATHLFPSFPVKSSYTSLFDKRPGMNYLYSANMESGLGIYDISVPNAITPILNFTIGNFNNLDVSTFEQIGNSLFVGIGDFQVNSNTSSGLAILDITNPTKPSVKDIWDSTSFHHGISHLIIEGNYAYLSTMSDGIIILDISDENNIIFKSSLQLDLNYPAPSANAHNARGLKYKNDTLYVCFDRGGLRVVDVTNKIKPVEVYKYINSTLNSQAAAAYNDIAIKGNYAFVSVDYCGLEVIDISSVPFTSVQWINPWGCTNSNWSGADLHTNELALANNDSILFVTGGQSELFAYDVTNPNTMKKLGQFVNLNDTLATHGLDVLNNKVSLSFIHTPFHIPPFTPFFADPGGLKLLEFNISTLNNSLFELDNNEESILIFPNPNSGNNINIKSNSAITKIMITNSIGELLYSANKIHKTEHTLTLESQETGMFFINIITTKGQTTKKIIIN